MPKAVEEVAKLGYQARGLTFSFGLEDTVFSDLVFRQHLFRTASRLAQGVSETGRDIFLGFFVLKPYFFLILAYHATSARWGQ